MGGAGASDRVDPAGGFAAGPATRAGTGDTGAVPSMPRDAAPGFGPLDAAEVDGGRGDGAGATVGDGWVGFAGTTAGTGLDAARPAGGVGSGEDSADEPFGAATGGGARSTLAAGVSAGLATVGTRPRIEAALPPRVGVAEPAGGEGMAPVGGAVAAGLAPGAGATLGVAAARAIAAAGDSRSCGSGGRSGAAGSPRAGSVRTGSLRTGSARTGSRRAGA